MSPEERLSRLERVAKLLVTSGRRTRTDLRTSIHALIDAQLRNEYSFHKKFAKLSAAQKLTGEQIKELVAAQKVTELRMEELAASQKELTASQKETDQRLRALIDIVGHDRNGEH